MTDMKQQVRKTLDSVTMPPLIGPLADLPDHVKQVVEAYGRACAREAIVAALRAAPEWQPIETAPENKLVVVGWMDDEGADRQEFDYIEDGLWIHHADLVEHAQMVAPPGSKMPKEQPPYQWWIDLPAFPAARPRGVKDAT
ncbi:MAG: hypothetical protein FH747_06575 [Stenotrophomonas sp.]|uniref:hypothetical protein n=1 Tax=Stenotrophomonas sp. TaxID=69392 RepID=UPI001355E37B|nr:hypothetical protein [Stenotrophomonas sp.]MTI73311.1 hypothetical protein [Stenotrophomonas sp.]